MQWCRVQFLLISCSIHVVLYFLLFLVSSSSELHFYIINNGLVIDRFIKKHILWKISEKALKSKCINSKIERGKPCNQREESCKKPDRNISASHKPTGSFPDFVKCMKQCSFNCELMLFKIIIFKNVSGIKWHRQMSANSFSNKFIKNYLL